MTIRTMLKDDYDKVYDLWINTSGMGLNTIDDSREGIEKYLDRNPTTCFVAEDDGKIIGVIIAGHDGRRGYIYHTAVQDNYRRKGIATKLLDVATKALNDLGIVKVALVVFERNSGGNAFWENQGFTTREDLIYRNKALTDITRIDT